MYELTEQSAPKPGRCIICRARALTFGVRKRGFIGQLPHRSAQRHIHLPVRCLNGHDDIMETRIPTCRCHWSKVGCPCHSANCFSPACMNRKIRQLMNEIHWSLAFKKRLVCEKVGGTEEQKIADDAFSGVFFILKITLTISTMSKIT